MSVLTLITAFFGCGSSSGSRSNRVPTTHDLQVTTVKGEPVAVLLAAEDPEGGPLSFTLVEPIHNGALVGTAPTLSYVPDDGFVGVDWFSFRVSDGAADSATATVIITVDEVNLAVASVVTFGSLAAPGGVQDFLVTVTNTGTRVIDGYRVRCSFVNNSSEPPTDDGTGVIVTAIFHDQGTLAAGQSIVFESSVRLGASGNTEIRTVVDSGEVVDESDESDNSHVLLIPIPISFGQPDFHLTDVHVIPSSNEIYAGSLVVVLGRLHNAGANYRGEPIEVAGRVDNYAGSMLGFDMTGPQVTMMSGTAFPFELWLEAGPAGTTTITVTGDSNADAEETSETNNQLIIPITIITYNG